jgi:hypothetical protein
LGQKTFIFSGATAERADRGKIPAYLNTGKKVKLLDIRFFQESFAGPSRTPCGMVVVMIPKD